MGCLKNIEDFKNIIIKSYLEGYFGIDLQMNFVDFEY